MMGYRKLDEIMELLTEELDGFNKAIGRLEKLTMNVDHITIVPDTTEIERLFREHLETERERGLALQRSIACLNEQMSRARLVPKGQLYIHYGIWAISLVIIGYLAFRVSRMDQVQDRAFAVGVKQDLSGLNAYFDEHPDHYRSYQKWIREKDRVPDKK